MIASRLRAIVALSPLVMACATGVSQGVALEVEGFTLAGDGAGVPATWQGRGTWRDATLLDTSAAVALRARRVVARDAAGNAIQLDRILVIDREADRATLVVDRGDDGGAPRGTPLAQLFSSAAAPERADIWASRAFCLAPGEAFELAFEVPAATDVVAFVAPSEGASVQAAYLDATGQLLWSGAIAGRGVVPFSLPARGAYAFVVVAAAASGPKTCGQIGAGELAWERGLGAPVAPSGVAQKAPVARPGAEVFRQAKTVGVLPVPVLGPSRERSYNDVAQAVGRAWDRWDAAAGSSAAPPPTDAALRSWVQLDTALPLGFSGASVEAELFGLRYGFGLGVLGSLRGADRTALAADLWNKRALLASLSPATLAAITRYLEHAQRGEADAPALAAALREAEAGTATDAARAHGYFVAGLWCGIAMTMATAQQPDLAFVALAGPLAAMFDEDAEFGGSDRTIAKALREAARIVAAPLVAAQAIDVGAFKAVVGSLLAAKSDAERP